MKIAILRERTIGEKRVAISPETVKKFIALGAEVLIEKGAGENSSISDKSYSDAGASVAATISETVNDADIILKVQPPFEKINDNDEFEYALFKKNAIYIGLLSPFDNHKNIENMADKQVTSIAMEFLPRITRAQSMDVLSSQSNLAGYKAVLLAAEHSDKVLPMMMTAAGTIIPAKVLILGAGVAGLQAIATAKRLGAVVSAFDVRPVVKEQVQSLGATFIEVPQNKTEEAETKGGYAKEMSKEYQERQKQLIHDTIKLQDIVITTALIPGKPAPKLITKEMVNDMKDGSVIVDLAAIAGGNCEYTERAKIIRQNGVTIIGHDNLPSLVARDASLLYSRNLFNFVSLLIDKNTKEIRLDMEDEIIKNSLVTHMGKVVHTYLSGAGLPATKASDNKSSVEEAREKKDIPAETPPKKVLESKPYLKKQMKSAQKPAKKKKQEVIENGE